MKKDIQYETYCAFDGPTLFAEGELETVVLKVKKRSEKSASSEILVFNNSTGKVMDFDLRGSEKDILGRLKVFMPENVKAESHGPGRPKLGVVAREVSLLPRHWEWLAAQSGGASATIRRLIDDAKKVSSPRDELRKAQERTYRFMSVIAGNLPSYEEALRALYAKNEKKFKQEIAEWPKDIAAQTKKLSRDCF